MSTIKELWLPIKGYEGLYEVSNTGYVRSIRRNIMIKPYLNHTGYLMVNLWCNCKQDKRLVSRLVAEHFVENKMNKPYVNHINGIKTDNRCNNLEWCTQSENVKHAYDTNLHKIVHRKLSDEDVLKIIELRKINTPIKEIAQKYNVSISLVSMLINGKRRKKVM